MAIQRVSIKLLGYDPEQVDGLLDRVKRQYENPAIRLVTPGMLAVAKFDLISGGYRIDQVDLAMAQVADDFEVRELSEKIEKYGKHEIRRDHRKAIGFVAETLARTSKDRFSEARNGYRYKLVEKLISETKVSEGLLIGPEPMDIRTRELGSARGGPSRSEVNEFLTQVVTVIHTQRLLGLLPKNPANQ
jgi:DivIVA domain-containing protein